MDEKVNNALNDSSGPLDTMMEYKVVHKRVWYQDNLVQSSMMAFRVVSLEPVPGGEMDPRSQEETASMIFTSHFWGSSLPNGSCFCPTLVLEVSYMNPFSYAHESRTSPVPAMQRTCWWRWKHPATIPGYFSERYERFAPFI